MTPRTSHPRTPVRAQGVGDELWVLFLEKAYAKLCGGYRHIVGGQTAEALHVLTGWPCEQYKLVSHFSH